MLDTSILYLSHYALKVLKHENTQFKVDLDLWKIMLKATKHHQETHLSRRDLNTSVRDTFKT